LATHFFFLPLPPSTGEMAEWSKAHAWKVCNRQKRFMGSNPILSANDLQYNNVQRQYYQVLQMGGKWHFDFMSIFGLFMVVIYIGCGIFVIASPVFALTKEIRIFFGGFMILYGIFRFVRIYFKLKNPES
jgi:hypothetical protein